MAHNIEKSDALGLTKKQQGLLLKVLRYASAYNNLTNREAAELSLIIEDLEKLKLKP